MRGRGQPHEQAGLLIVAIEVAVLISEVPLHFNFRLSSESEKRILPPLGYGARTLGLYTFSVFRTKTHVYNR